MYKIKKGLDLPILGEAKGLIEEISVSQVGVLGPDYNGMKPTMLVKEGDSVQKGQKLFEDKKNPGVFFCAPASGIIDAVNRGEKRKLLSVVINIDNNIETLKFKKYLTGEIENISKDDVASNLIESGMWSALRTRPYSKIPQVGTTPNSIFITAIDTNPLAINPELVITERNDDFQAGLAVLSRLTEGKTYLCKEAGSKVTSISSNVEDVEFSGKHPAGLVGTHIHKLDPVNGSKTVWHINYQDVIAVGSLFLNGELDNSRVLSIAGPAATNPRFVKTILGASIADLVLDQIPQDIDVRVVNGSVLSGARVGAGTEYLARYALQISILEEGDKKEFMGWMGPGFNKFTMTKTYIGSWFPKKFKFTTSTGGSPRSIVPIDVYEKVMPLDILPVLLLKSIIMKDTDEAQRLGVLELDEEDLALCTFVCPSKYEYGAILRENLEQIERDG